MIPLSILYMHMLWGWNYDTMPTSTFSKFIWNALMSYGSALVIPLIPVRSLSTMFSPRTLSRGQPRGPLVPVHLDLLVPVPHTNGTNAPRPRPMTVSPGLCHKPGLKGWSSLRSEISPTSLTEGRSHRFISPSLSALLSSSQSENRCPYTGNLT